MYIMEQAGFGHVDCMSADSLITWLFLASFEESTCVVQSLSLNKGFKQLVLYWASVIFNTVL